MTVQPDICLWQSAAKTLIALGFPADHKGYEYIRCAIVEVSCDPELTGYVTKTLYPRVARICGEPTASNVSRACRRAIAYACDFGELRDFIGAAKSDSYPSNTLVISTLAKYIGKQNKKN